MSKCSKHCHNKSALSNASLNKTNKRNEKVNQIES